MSDLEPTIYHKFVDVDYYKTPYGFVALERSVFQGEWGPVQVGRGPHWGSQSALETVTTYIYGAHRKDSWAKVEAKDVPDDWYNKLGYGLERKKLEWWWVALGYLSLGIMALALTGIVVAVSSFFAGL